MISRQRDKERKAMNLLTLSKDGIPLLNGDPIEGLVAFKLSQDSVDDIPVFEAKILVHLNPKAALNDFTFTE